MFRVRRAFLLCGPGRGGYRGTGMQEPSKLEMPLKEAYTMFNFNLSDQLTEKEIKKRYITLAKVCHPDGGGTPEKFRKLKIAQKTLLQNKHEPSIDKKKVTFTRVSRAEALNVVDAQNVKESMATDVSDALAMFIVVPFLAFLYYWHNTGTLTRLSDARSRMSADEMRPQKKVEDPSHEWHPWRADNETKAHVQDVLEDRKRRLGLDQAPEEQQAAPLQQSPFASSSPQQRQRSPL